MEKVNKDKLKLDIDRLEIEVYHLGKEINKIIEKSKTVDEDSFLTEEEEKLVKINNTRLKLLKAEQKQKNDLRKTFRSIYSDLMKDSKSSGDKSDALSELLSFIKDKNYQSNIPSIQQKQ